MHITATCGQSPGVALCPQADNNEGSSMTRVILVFLLPEADRRGPA